MSEVLHVLEGGGYGVLGGGVEARNVQPQPAGECGVLENPPCALAGCAMKSPQPMLLITNARIASEDSAALVEGDVLVVEGKIQKIGKGAFRSGGREGDRCQGAPADASDV